jgi:hypothetical protein
MRKNYSTLTNNVRSRLNPDNILLSKGVLEELSTIQYNDVLTYIRYAMNGVEPEYTAKSKLAGQKVKEHLSSVLTNVDYEYQGSVMTDTHIKGHSDIDLLVITKKFYQWTNFQVGLILNSPEYRQLYSAPAIQRLEQENNVSTYTGDSLSDLRTNRLTSETKMIGTYEICDISKPKAIEITNQSLNREVDIVIANWYDDVQSIINGKGIYRGIQVYNKSTKSQENADFPFLSIDRINSRSSSTNGRTKKMIRFLKNCKANSGHDIKDISSFDINAICYDISPDIYKGLAFYSLVPVLYNQLYKICTDGNHADSIKSVDSKEDIFKGKPEKIRALKLILAEVEAIYLDLKENSVLSV